MVLLSVVAFCRVHGQYVSFGLVDGGEQCFLLTKERSSKKGFVEYFSLMETKKDLNLENCVSK